MPTTTTDLKDDLLDISDLPLVDLGSLTGTILGDALAEALVIPPAEAAYAGFNSALPPRGH